MKASKQITPKTTVRILKIGSCPTLSGKSTLTYHVGFQGTVDILFRVYANSGGGFFSNEWVAASDIQGALSKSALITAFSLHPIFKGKSANTAGFLLAVLKEESLIGRSTENPRCYVATESPVFVAEMQALMASAVDLDPDTQPTKKSVAAKGVKSAADSAKPAKPVKAVDELPAKVPAKSSKKA
ncbi:MAG: hypothetical protein Q7K57_47710 [Burkholderiaceae bacterium]|nr:hypothetical protein [Burkholderiaceae bacterium]